ncbi:uncharacterized protein [Rutidosis leptorrhynchoides]|uniref:uncharacterized protein n=1 Tax=Rutidosis leptorrhynchoides TaxID=125765 RepID=UPI003A98FD86
MEDTFKVRVDKAFGSLESSSSSTIKSQQTSSLNSLWCLTDEEIERNKWLQDKIEQPHDDIDEQIHRLKNPKPYSPFLQGLIAEPETSDQKNLESDIQELDDDEDDDDENRKPELIKPDDHDNEEWNIRTSVGMDCTLDNEEEEDAFDKVAVGKEEAADRYYLKSVNDYDVDIDSINERPNSFSDVIKDPRANHMAAKLRLKEDDESLKKLGLQVSENNIQKSTKTAIENKEQLVNTEPQGTKVVPFFPQSSSSLPDYVRNPSKYTHYTFDSKDDVDEETNRKVYIELFNSMKGSDMMDTEDVSNDSLKSITFTPKKKSGDVIMKNSKGVGYEDKKVVPISIVDSEDVCMMDEDEPEMATNKGSGLKGGRRYRTKGGIRDE